MKSTRSHTSKNWIRYFLTPGRNNRWDLGYLIWLVGCGLYLYRGFTATWDFVSYGAGLVAVLGSGKAMEWLSNRSDMDGQDQDDSHRDRGVGSDPPDSR